MKKNSLMDISIIIPVYNVEKYLVRCLDSVFNQQFSGKYEVIAVDDASTDHSLQILSDYQKKENRLKIIPLKINSKQPIARSAGMDASLGTYVMHVDADDWILPNILEPLFAKCKETNADVVVFNYDLENSTGERKSIEKIKNELVTTNKLEVKQHFLGATWNKIVKRALTVDMVSGKVAINISEDLLYATEILFRANIICLISQRYYIYCLNPESITHTVKPPQHITSLLSILGQLQIINSKYNPNSRLTRYILNYFEGLVYLEFAKAHFLSRSNKNNLLEIVEKFSNYPLLSNSRIKRFKLSLFSRFICLIEITYRLGLKTTLGLIFRRFTIQN